MKTECEMLDELYKDVKVAKTCENCKWSKRHNGDRLLACHYNAPVKYFPTVGVND